MKKILLFFVLILILSCGPKIIKIGVILPQSGQWSLYGSTIREGIELAESYIKDNKIIKETIQLMWYDSNSNPETAKEMVKKAVEDGCVAIIGGITTSEALKMIEILDKERVIMISPSASAAELSSRTTYFFRIFPSDRYEVSNAAKFIIEDKATKKLGIIYQDNEFSDFISRNLEFEVKNLGVEQTVRVVVKSDCSNLQEAVNEVMKISPKAIYIATYTDIFPQVLREIKSRNYAGDIITTSAFNSPGTLSQVAGYSEGLYFFRPPFDPKDKNNATCQAFVSKYKEIYGKEPDIFQAYGFDSLLVLVEGIKIGGYFTEDLYKGLRSLSNFQGVTGLISFTAQGEVLKYPRIYTIKDGQPIDYMEYQEAQRRAILMEIEKEKEKLKGLTK